MKVLNEVVVDRGPSSYLSNVDLYLDGRLITSVQGDGEHRFTGPIMYTFIQQSCVKLIKSSFELFIH